VENTATSGSGGAIDVLYSSIFESYNNTFTSNMADLHGGAIFALIISRSMSDSFSVYNLNFADDGGAIFIENGENLNFNNVAYLSN
jgi:predicted outer membrane repeat protein